MEKEEVFINCIPGNRKIGEKLKIELLNAGISAYLPPEPGDVNSMVDIVAHIESIARENGIMLAILSQSAATDNLFVSNIQYMCELAGKRLALVIYKIEEIAKLNAVALYYPQSITVNATRNNAELSINKAVLLVKRALGVESQRAYIPARLSKKVVKKLVMAVAVLSLIASFLVYFAPFIKAKISANIPAPVPTPVIMTVPFSGESIDQGLIVDRRFAPVYQAGNDPEKEAPFFHPPAVISKKLTFTDPVYDNTLDFSNIGITNIASISDTDLNVINQVGGVLQISASAHNHMEQEMGVPINYFFTTGETTYLGIRFSMGDYTGWTNAKQPVKGDFGLQANQQYYPLVHFCISQQILNIVSEPHTAYFVGSKWHTLELVIDKNNPAALYLDGKKIDTLNSLPDVNTLANLYAGYQVQSTTDWVHLYFNEVLYGQNKPAQIAEQPEQAIYHFTPAAIYYQNKFVDRSIDQFLTGSNQFVTISDGKLIYSIPAQAENPEMDIHMQVRPISEVNYYSMKYRFIDQKKENWSDGGALSIYLENPALEHPKGMFPLIEVSTYKAEYRYHLGGNDWYGISGAPENFQTGAWHTMEMLIIPPSSTNENYVEQFWQDGHLVGEGPIQNAEQILGPDAVDATFQILPGDHRENPFSCEIDEITIGNIPVSANKE